MTLKILQCNLNHTKAAQDLCIYNCRNWGINVAVVSEPYITTAVIKWTYDLDGLVLVIDYDCEGNNSYLQILSIGHGYVSFKYSDIIIVGAYISPNTSFREYSNRLTELEIEICKYRSSYYKFLVIGDFNAKSGTWGSKTANLRGEEVEKWAASLDLNIVNNNNNVTCISRRENPL